MSSSVLAAAANNLAEQQSFDQQQREAYVEQLENNFNAIQETAQECLDILGVLDPREKEKALRTWYHALGELMDPQMGGRTRTLRESIMAVQR